MKKIVIKSLFIILAIFGLAGTCIFNSVPAMAEGEDKATSEICASKANADVKRAAGCYGNTDSVVSIVTIILNSIIAVIGIVAVIFIVIGGINYMTSQGDPGKLKKARDTILYACIGLVVCALAFAIVNWTIGIINNSSKKGKPTDYSKQEDCENAGWAWSKADSKATKETCHE